jgi:hypothetical protein
VIGLALVGVIWMLINNGFYAAVVGRKTLDVWVHVIDAHAQINVPNAKVTVFTGPWSPVDGVVIPRIDPYGESEEFATGADGWCRFKHKFWAWWDERPSGSIIRGSVRTGEGWIKVTAAGRPTALVPLDRQSQRPTSIHDERPVVVTVVLNKSDD